MSGALPHEELVQEIRRLIVGLFDTRAISDDADMYYVGAADYSPIERADEANTANLARAAELAQRLVELGDEAADAVAKGLRMQGRWREYLLPHARAHVDQRAILAALRLVAARKRDPLAQHARTLLGGRAEPAA